jgi:hypothetical protein
MKCVEEQLMEALDQVAAKDVNAAKKINGLTVTAEEKLATAQALLEGAPIAPAWRATGGDKLIQEIRESSTAFRPTVVKHNGRVDNWPVVESQRTLTEAQLKLIEGFQAMGLTLQEATVAAECDETEADHYMQLMKEGAE